MTRIPPILTGGSILLLQAACPPKLPGTTETTFDPESTTVATDALTGTTTPTTSATSTEVGTTEVGTTTAGTTTADFGTTTAGTTTAGTTTAGTTTGAGTTTAGTTGDGTTTGDSTGDPIDVGCTYPGSTSGDASSPDVDEACACVEGTSVVCGAKICPTITGKCDEFDFDGCYGTWQFADAALDCAIKAAAAGTEGTIEWYFTANGGFSSHSGFLHIVPGRRAIRQDVDVTDLDTSVSDTELWNLDNPAWFEGCLELPTFCERMDCFFDGTDGAALSLCQDGFDYSY